MGSCYFNSHDMVRAEFFYTEAIRINPNYIKALHKRALARYELEKIDGAFEDIKAAFALDRKNAEIHSAYSKILEKYNENTRKSKAISEKMFKKESQISSSPQKQKEEKTEDKEEGEREMERQRKREGRGEE